MNEPETSLHPQLLAPLGRLIGRASRDSQLFLTTHSRELADHVAQNADVRTVELSLVGGETRVEGEGADDEQQGRTE